MKYDAVIFDLFGTLVDNMPYQAFSQALAAMAEVVGVPASEMQRMWGVTWPLRSIGKLPDLVSAIRYICDQLGVSPDPQQVEEAAQIRLEFSRRALVPRHDTVETLSQIKAEGYKIGLVSDCTAEVPLLWSTTALAPLIDVPIFSCSVGLKKPDPRIFRLACERLQVEAQRCLFMGDGGSNELRGASAVGMFAVQIRVPYENEHNVHRHDEELWHGPLITSVKDILPFVDTSLVS